MLLKPGVVLCLALAGIAAAGPTAHAQQRGAVIGTVLSESGQPLSDVRVRITAGKLDTVVRTTVKGTFYVALPEGRAHFSLARIGYAPNDGDVDVVKTVSVQMRLRALPQQLSAVNVREDWIGIRGVVGDDSTMDVLKGVTITSMKRTINLVTDSLGRFEFSLPKRERTSLMLTRSGYRTKPFVVPMDSANSADVIVLMKRGNDPITTKYVMTDLQHRMAWGGVGMFVLDHTKLETTGQTRLIDAIGASGMPIRKGIQLELPGVFLDGLPSNSGILFDLKVSEVEIVEVWGKNSDATRSLAARWPGGSIGTGGGGPWIAVWRR